MASSLLDVYTLRAELLTERSRLDAQLAGLDQVIANMQARNAPYSKVRMMPTCNPTHSRIHMASVNGRAMPKPNWNSSVWMLSRHIKTRDEFSVLVTPTWQEGRYGKYYVKHLDLSYSGQNAIDALRTIYKIANHCNLDVELEIGWKRRGQYPFKSLMISI